MLVTEAWKQVFRTPFRARTFTFFRKKLVVPKNQTKFQISAPVQIVLTTRSFFMFSQIRTKKPTNFGPIRGVPKYGVGQACLVLSCLCVKSTYFALFPLVKITYSLCQDKNIVQIVLEFEKTIQN
jgi:hypothetical protein